MMRVSDSVFARESVACEELHKVEVWLTRIEQGDVVLILVGYIQRNAARRQGLRPLFVMRSSRRPVSALRTGKVRSRVSELPMLPPLSSYRV